jgi:hypothetical protein
MHQTAADMKAAEEREGRDEHSVVQAPDRAPMAPPTPIMGMRKRRELSSQHEDDLEGMISRVLKGEVRERGSSTDWDRSGKGEREWERSELGRGSGGGRLSMRLDQDSL